MRDHGRSIPPQGEQEALLRSVAGSREGFNAPEVLPFAHIPRRRLTNFIARPFQPAVTLIVAGAGAGKTTLAIEWAMRSPAPVAWLSFDHEPEHLSALIDSMRSALRPALEAGGDPNGSLESTGQDERAGFLAELAAIDRDVNLVLDNCEVVTGPEQVALLDEIISLPGNRLKTILIGRRPLSLRLGRHRSLGRVRELGSQELRFTRSEAESVLRALVGAELPGHEIDRITRDAEGWVAGVVLCGLAIHRATEQGIEDPTDGRMRNMFLDEYVQQEILAQMPTATRKFVLATSELPWLASELCDAALNRNDSADILTALDDHFPFLYRHQPESSRHRYHRLVGESLGRLAVSVDSHQDRLDRSQRSAAWLVEHGEVAAAAELALTMPDAPWAAQMLAPFMRSLIDRSDFEAIERLLELVPEDLIESSLDLAWWRIAARLGLRNSIGVESLVNAISPRLLAAGEPIHAGRLSLGRGMLAFGDGRDDEAGDHLTAALEILPREAAVERMHVSTILGLHAFRQGRDDDAALAFKQAESCAALLPLEERWSWFVLAPGRANSYALRGDLYSAITKYRLIIAEIPPYLSAAGIEGFIRCRLISLYIERNDLDAARHEYEIVESLITGDSRAWHRDAIVARTRLLLASGRREEAEKWAADHLKRLRRLPEKTQLVHLLARIWLERAEYPLVESWLADVDPSGYPWAQVFGDINYRILSLSLDLVRGRFKEAARAAERMTTQAVDARRWSEFVPLSVRWAVALQHMGRERQSRDVLRPAIERAVAGGFVRGFHVPGFDTVTMFADVWSEKQAYQPIRRGLQEILGHAAQVGSVAISKRELEVLRHVAEGRTNQQIAASMYISTNTVRNHLVRIGQRLQAHNRQQAVARARHLGILD